MRKWQAAAAVMLVLALGACRGGGEAEPTPSATTETRTDQTEAPETEAVETEAPAPTEGNEQRTYRVREGDTLSAIAERFDTTVRALARANNLDDPNQIQVGQRLRIPSGN